MNTAKTSLRLIASALALAAGLAIGAVASAAVAMPATDIDLYGVPTAFSVAHQRFDVVRAPAIGRGSALRRGDPTAFGLSQHRFDVVRAPAIGRGGPPSAGGGVWTGLAAGY